MTAGAKERMSWAYLASYWIFGTALRIWNHYRSHDPENVPRKGPCIIASNHASFLDPLVVGCGVSFRQIFFMGRRSLSKNPLMRWWMNSIGVVFVDRDRGDVGAIKAGLRILKSGRPFFLFPEGTRTLDGNLQPAKGGVGFLIARAAAPVVPVYVKGTFDASPKGRFGIRRAPISVWYGAPIQPEEYAGFLADRDGYVGLGAMVMARIAELKAKADASQAEPPGPGRSNPAPE